MTNQSPADAPDPGTADAITEVETQVQCRLSGQIQAFHLEHREGGVILRGRTHSYHARALAQQTVEEATSSPVLANEIEVC